MAPNRDQVIHQAEANPSRVGSVGRGLITKEISVTLGRPLMLPYVPIRDILWLGDFQFAAANGNYLLIYELPHRPTSNRYDLVRSIRLHEDGDVITKVIFHGDSLLFAASGRKLTSASLEGEPRSSWLLPDKIVCMKADDNYINIVLAHGQFLALDVLTGQLISIARLEIDFLVLSASIYCMEGERHVAYGSVFDGVHLFKLPSVEGSHAFLEPSGILNGHAGSIFDISYCSSSAGRHILSTCSDDRKIIIWDLQSRTQLAKLEGHTSRVWRVLWYKDLVISAGEDSAIRIWNFKDQEPCINVLGSIVGSSTWCIDVQGDYLISGSDDCGIRLWNLAAKKQALECVGYPASIPKSFDFSSNGSKASIVALHEDGSLTENGRLLKNPFPKDVISRHGLIREVDEIRAIGTLSGVVYVVIRNLDKIFTLDFGFGSRITFLEVFKVGEFLDKYLFFAQSGNGLAGIATLNRLACTVDVRRLDVKPGTVCCVCSIYSNHSRLLMIGTRDGRLSVICTNSNREISCRNLSKFSPDAITSMIPWEENLLITDRSGYLSCICLNNLHTGAEVLWRHRLTKGWLEQVLALNGELVVVGFESVESFVYSFTRKQEVYRCETGGAHRFWRASAVNGPSLAFGFIRLGNIYHTLIDFNNTSPQAMAPIREHLHGAEIRAVEVLPGTDFFVTGGEDGKICLFEMCHRAPSNFRLQDSNTSHRSGVKCLYAIDKNLFLSGGSAEELLLWSVVGDRMNCRLNLLDRYQSKFGEARVMSIAGNEQEFVASLSDSSLLVGSVSLHPKPTIKISHETAVHLKHCPLKLESLPQFSNNYISGASDGELSKIFTEQEKPTVRTIIKLPSAINALSVNYCGKYAVFGLDGGQYGVVRLEEPIDPEGYDGSDTLISLVHAHHSCVTAVGWISPSHIFSASVDQRILIHHFSGSDGRTPQLAPVTSQESSIVSSVADISDAKLFPTKSDGRHRLIVVGSGIQIIELTI